MSKTTTSKTKAIGDVRAVAEELVSRLQGEILHEGCVVFLGAGSTTERDRHGARSFYDHIKAISHFPAASPTPSFPELMEYFCDHVDGGRHNRLIREALSRIEYFCIPGEDNTTATMFTDSLAEIPYLNRFATTNWDPFLERSLDVLVPMVEDRDLAFWDDRKRQVLKIHGCITRPYSLVATQRDYDTCMDRNPLIFNKLKDLMTTKTFLFSGYSMRDPDFQKVWDGITHSLGHFAKLAYALDPGATSDEISFWKKRGIELFRIHDVAFARTLRERLEKEDFIPPARFLEFLQRQHRRIVNIHIKMAQTSDGRFASAMYQDGLLHALGDVLSAAKLGTKKKEHFDTDRGEAEENLAQVRRKHDSVEIAYWSGRCEVIRRFVSRTRAPIPAYFHPYRLRAVSHLVQGKKF